MTAEEERLAEEVRKLRICIEGCADQLRGSLTVRAVNDIAWRLNAHLPHEKRVKLFGWGTTTVTDLRDVVGKLGRLVGMNWPDQPMMLGEPVEEHPKPGKFDP